LDWCFQSSCSVGISLAVFALVFVEFEPLMSSLAESNFLSLWKKLVSRGVLRFFCSVSKDY
jgi:hypothetical protein